MVKHTPPKITRKKLTDYLPDDHNANAGTERGLQMIEDSLQQDGVGRSIVADAMGRVPAGNKTLEAAMNAGITEVIEIETDGNALIVHKRSDWDLSDPTGAARRYAYRDNRAAEVGLSWSADQIAADVEAGVDLSHMFTANELNYIAGQGIIPNDPYAEWVGMPEFEQENKEGIILRVHFANTEARAEFFTKLGLSFTDKTNSIWYPERPEDIKNQLGNGLVYTDES